MTAQIVLRQQSLKYTSCLLKTHSSRRHNFVIPFQNRRSKKTGSSYKAKQRKACIPHKSAQFGLGMSPICSKSYLFFFLAVLKLVAYFSSLCYQFFLVLCDTCTFHWRQRRRERIRRGRSRVLPVCTSHTSFMPVSSPSKSNWK